MVTQNGNNAVARLDLLQSGNEGIEFRSATVYDVAGKDYHVGVLPVDFLHKILDNARVVAESSGVQVGEQGNGEPVKIFRKPFRSYVHFLYVHLSGSDKRPPPHCAEKQEADYGAGCRNEIPTLPFEKSRDIGNNGGNGQGNIYDSFTAMKPIGGGGGSGSAYKEPNYRTGGNGGTPGGGKGGANAGDASAGVSGIGGGGGSGYGYIENSEYSPVRIMASMSGGSGCVAIRMHLKAT